MRAICHNLVHFTVVPHSHTHQIEVSLSSNQFITVKSPTQLILLISHVTFNFYFSCICFFGSENFFNISRQIPVMVDGRNVMNWDTLTKGLEHVAQKVIFVNSIDIWLIPYGPSLWHMHLYLGWHHTYLFIIDIVQLIRLRVLLAFQFLLSLFIFVENENISSDVSL